MQELVIEISPCALEKCNVSDASSSACAETGTVVELAPLKEPFDWLLSRDAFLEFNAVFASYVLQYPGISISYNGRAIDPADTIFQSFEFPRQAIVGPHRTVDDLSLKVIEWNSVTEGRLQFIQDKLRVEVSGEEIEQRIAVLRTSLQRGQAAKVVPFPGSESKVASAS